MSRGIEESFAICILQRIGLRDSSFQDFGTETKLISLFSLIFPKIEDNHNFINKYLYHEFFYLQNLEVHN